MPLAFFTQEFVQDENGLHFESKKDYRQLVGTLFRK